MHTRLNAIVVRGRIDASRRRLLNEARRQNQRGLSSRNYPSPYVNLVQSHHGPFRQRPRESLSLHAKTPFSRLHTTSRSLAPPASALQQQSNNEYDEDKLEQDIEMFTSSCMSQLLPDSIFYSDGERSKLAKDSTTLDKELGIGSVWESSELDEDDAEDENDILEEEQVSSSLTKRIESPQLESVTRKSAMEILRNFDPQNPPDSDDPEELQLWLECAAQREAVTRYQNLIKKARDRKAFESMSLIQRLVIKWYQDLRDSIEVEQKEFLTNQGSRPAKKRYGPFLCSLHPEKLAVILSHEAITQCLLYSGRNGQVGIPLTKLATAIGTAVETEVVSQRRIKERFHDTTKTTSENGDESNADDKPSEDDENESTASEEKKPLAIDRWKFSASHLKLFMEELQRIDPNLGRNRRAINYAMRRAKQAMNSEDSWSTADIVHVGAALLSFLVENAKVYHDGKEEPAFRVDKRWSGSTKSTSFIVLNDNLHKLFVEDDFFSWAATTTRYTPMIVPPSDWVGPKEGGYRWLNAELMRTHGSNFQKEALEHFDLSLVCDGLNILGKTAWKINKEILKVAQYCKANNIAIGDIPPGTDHEITPEPVRPDRIAPEIYANSENDATQAVIAANKAYRDQFQKRRRIAQKNMVRGVSLDLFLI